MMIKYTQLAPAYDEYPVTGVNARWQPGQLSDVTGARLTALLATGLFADVELGTQEAPITASTSAQGAPANWTGGGPATIRPSSRRCSPVSCFSIASRRISTAR